MDSMVQGVGQYHTLRGKGDTKALLGRVQDHVATAQQASAAPPVRATVVSTDSGSTSNNNNVVLVEEWTSSIEFKAYMAEEHNRDLHESIEALVSDTPQVEEFPEILHICQSERMKKDVGILARQKTSTAANGERLRDAQREAYERQIKFEPGCTCCIILANSKADPSQVRIIELWKTMQDFSFHEASEWHAKGEEKVVPLVVDMDCDFCSGTRIL